MRIRRRPESGPCVLAITAILLTQASCGDPAAPPGVAPAPQRSPAPGQDPSPSGPNAAKPSPPAIEEPTETGPGPPPGSSVSVPFPLPGKESFSVLVLGPDGLGVPGVSTTAWTRPVDGGREWTSYVPTDANGRAVYERKDGRVWFALSCDPLGAWRALEHDEIVLKSPPRVPVDVRFVDMHTGRALDPQPAFHFVPSRPVRGGSEMDQVWIAPGGAAEISVRLLEVPPGYVRPLDGLAGRKIATSADTTRIELTVPLPRRLPVTLRVRDGDGTPLAAEVYAKKSWLLRHEEERATGPDGELELADIPVVRGETLTVWTRVEGRGVVLHRLPLDPRDGPVTLEFVYDDSIEADVPPRPMTVGIGGSGTRHMRSFGASDDTDEGEIELIVVRHDGSPAAGAKVILSGAERRSNETDASGRVVFRRLAAGSYGALVDEPGIARTRVDIDVSGSGRHTAALREAPPKRFRVRVQDKSGRPVPGVLVFATMRGGYASEPIEQIRDGVLRAQLLTDAKGEVELTGLNPPEVTIRALHGSHNVGHDPGDDEDVVLTLDL